jgi:outer membrane protein assembly factor BamB
MFWRQVDSLKNREEDFDMQRLALILCLLSYSTVLAENWPGWRGPTGQGVSSEQELPVKWDRTENVRWKVALPDVGNSTPIVWVDKIFVTQASDRKLWPPQVPKDFPKGVSSGGAAILEKRSVLCFSRADGQLLWQADTIYPLPEATHPTNPFCSASPVTDGERVIASHGSAGLVCYDLAGKQLWKYDVGKLEHVWGNASSPVLHGDLCIHWCGPGDRQFLLAVNKKTGEKVWQVDDLNGDSGLTSGKFIGSWCSPLVARVGEQDQLIFSTPGKLTGYDPLTGQVLWTSGRDAKGGYSYPSPLFVDGTAIYNGTLTKLGGSGDISRDQFKYKVGSMYISSAVIFGDYLYTLNNVGVPACYEWKTGTELWKDQISERPGGTTAWGSLVYGAGRIYVTDQRGSTLVFAAGSKYEHLATNKLAESTNASLAISDGDIFIRTHKHLWCISERK